jgi:hypothetical protein
MAGNGSHLNHAKECPKLALGARTEPERRQLAEMAAAWEQIALERERSAEARVLYRFDGTKFSAVKYRPNMNLQPFKCFTHRGSTVGELVFAITSTYPPSPNS